MSAGQDRQSLAEAQARLVRALGAQQPPAGFDRSQFDQAARSLMNKRRRGIEKAWPAVVRLTGDRFAALFARYARATAFPPDGSHHSDAKTFAAFLLTCEELPADVRLDLLQRVDQRGPIRITHLPGTDWTAISIRLPLLPKKIIRVQR